jgi:hypothetical protein
MYRCFLPNIIILWCLSCADCWAAVSESKVGLVSRSSSNVVLSYLSVVDEVNSLVHDVLCKIFEEMQDVLNFGFIWKTSQANAVLLRARSDHALWKHRDLRKRRGDLSNEWRFWRVLLVGFWIHRAI